MSGRSDFSLDDSKAFVKLLQNTKIGETYPEIYQEMRKSDHDLTKNTMKVLSKKGNEKLLEAAKLHILNSIHLDNILGLNKRQDGDVDEFITGYGIEPDGVFMDETTLGKLFGPKFKSILAESIYEVRSGKRSPDDLKKFISDNMTIDFENNKINFKQEFENPDYDPTKPESEDNPKMLETEYPLWDWHARAKGLGNAPAMELQQDPFLAKSLQEGTPDVRKWHPKTHHDYLTGKLTVLKKEIKELKELGMDTTKLERQKKEWEDKKKELKKNKDFKTSREEWNERKKKGDVTIPPQGETGSPDLGPDDFEKQVPF